MAKLALHTVEDAGCDQGAERITDQTTAREDRGAHAKFRALVPLRQQEQGAGEERSLHKAEEETREEGADEAIVFRSASFHGVQLNIYASGLNRPIMAKHWRSYELWCSPDARKNGVWIRV